MSWNNTKCPDTRAKSSRRVQKRPGTVRSVPTLKVKCPGRVRKSVGAVRGGPTLERSLLEGFREVLGEYEVS